MRHLIPTLLLAIVLSSCSQPARQEIEDVREPSATKRKAPPKLSATQRFNVSGSSESAAESDQNSENDPLGGTTFHHDLPEGWEKAPLTQFRQVNLRMTETPEAEFYFTFLPGGGGGLKANLNRWRSQMGQDDLSDDAIAALPQRPIFGQPATYIQIDGEFGGMGGAAKKPDFRLYGLILTYTDPNTQKDQAFFLKMVGPRGVLENQGVAFDLVASSLHAVGPDDNHSHDEHGPGDGHNHGEAPMEAEAHGPGDGHNHGAEAAHGEPSEAKATEQNGSGFQWTLPGGWAEIAPTMMRQANLTITGQEDVECYFTVLGGTGGGLDMNINRWQKQMGQSDLAPDAISALAKHPLLGAEGVFVTIDGTFGGMRATTQKENFRMYGLMRVEETQAFFVKMTGPQDVLADQEANFLAFSASLKPGAQKPATEAAPMADANPHGVGDPTPTGGFNPEGLTWAAPEGWEEGGERMMRVVTYTFGEAECYITSLAGAAGGVNDNINRWVGQMGQSPLDEAGLAALPQISILGKEAPMIDVAGSFKGMSGVERPDFKMLGTVIPMGDQTVFVKMIGPKADVDSQKENFVAFCASIAS